MQPHRRHLLRLRNGHATSDAAFQLAAIIRHPTHNHLHRMYCSELHTRPLRWPLLQWSWDASGLDKHAVHRAVSFHQPLAALAVDSDRLHSLRRPQPALSAGRCGHARLEQHVVCLSVCALIQQQAEAALPALHTAQLKDVTASLASLVPQRYRQPDEPRQAGCAPDLGMPVTNR